MRYSSSSIKKYGVGIDKYLLLIVTIIVFSIGFIYFRKVSSSLSFRNTPPTESSQPATPNGDIQKDDMNNASILETEAQTPVSEKNKLSRYLPISIQEFETYPGIKTNITISINQLDSDNLVRFEIEGVDFLSEGIGQGDPEHLAFIDSMEKAFSEIEKKGVNPHALDIVFYSGGKINPTAESWAQKFGFLRQ